MFTVLLIVALCVLVLAYGWFLEPAWLAVNEQSVEVGKGSLHEPIRILFISDLHVGRFTRLSLWKRRMATLRALHAKRPFDLLVLGGDYLDSDLAYLPVLRHVLAELRTLGLPIFGVLGNHDYSSSKGSIETIASAMSEEGVTILKNSAYMFRKDAQKVALIGMDDMQQAPGYHSESERIAYPQYKKRIAGVDWYARFDEYQPNLVRVLIGHNPDVVYLNGAVHPDVVLAGHTHGGQMLWVDWLSRPLYAIFGKMVPPGSFVTWAGRRLIAKTTLIVSRGIEGSAIPFRFARRPDIVALTLEPARTAPDLLIGLSGKPHVGKDTVASMIETLFPGINRAAFADAIKQEYDAANGTDTLHDVEQKKKHRMGIHALGDARRAEDHLYWVKKTMHHPRPLLVTDVRQPQEVKAVREGSGWLVRVVCSDATMRERLGEYYDEHAHHQNETKLDDYAGWDFVINNDGTLEELETQVRKVAAEIRRRGTQHPSSR